MNSLRAITENQIRSFLNVSDDEFTSMRNPAPEQMHDPGLYSDMKRLVAYLHEEKNRQDRDPQKILAVFGDYDTDGVCSSGVLSGSLNVFGFRYMTGIPTMDQGYGLSQAAVDEMMERARKSGYKIDMIITADNGINAYDGIAYAAQNGITVLVTDHHPAGPELPQGASVCVDPWKKGDTYPFKYNSGATVAWKTMLEYAKEYDPDKRMLIEQLIVLAGMSNVADVMQITDENRYMVVRAVEILDDLRREWDYKKMANTRFVAYNTVFWGLHDLITLLQESKDAKRRAKGKNPVPLPRNEELISWYLSPMLNAPRRVHGTCLEAMSALLIPDHELRKQFIRNLIELNSMKTDFRDKVLKKIDKQDESPVVCVNTRHGISGLIAGRLAEDREMPSIVFARRDDASDTVVYDEVPEDGFLVASARSSEICPLNRVIEEVNRQYPGMIKGGGHATAAGITIKAKDYDRLKEILPGICSRIISQTKASGVAVVENKVIIRCLGENLSVSFGKIIDGVLTEQVEFIDSKMFSRDVIDTYNFLESLRPFGAGFEADTKFELWFDRSVMGPSFHWNPSFWKTFKFDISGVECLTFDEAWADDVKLRFAGDAKDIVIQASAQISMNVFKGRTTPQLQLSPL